MVRIWTSSVLTAVAALATLSTGLCADEPPAACESAVPPTRLVAPGRPGYWQPGGYEGRIGSPYFYSTSDDWSGQYRGYGGFLYVPPTRLRSQTVEVPGVDGDVEYRLKVQEGLDPYTYHFGPGFYRHATTGHYRFPYYS
ncbi:MAG: hypothetical protein KY476_17840, partial [Planctomycetes bacterium]|nr:hypothetical protein [Planctomycetota bacterium]